MWLTRLLLLAFLLAPINAVGGHDDPGKPKPVPPVPAAGQPPRSPKDEELANRLLPPPRVLRPTDYPQALGELVHIYNRFAVLEHGADLQFAEIGRKYNQADPEKRWEWLTAKRAAVREYDRACREAAEIEAAFWASYLANPAEGKKLLRSYAKLMPEFYNGRRLTARESWYHTATTHYWRWERHVRGWSWTTRTWLSVCKSLGLTNQQGIRFLAWVDLLATDLLPRHMSQFLTVPFTLMS